MTDPVLSHPTGPLAGPIRTDAPGPTRCGCNPSHGQDCDYCGGPAQEQREYWQATRPQRRAFDAAMAAWWLRADDQRNTA